MSFQVSQVIKLKTTVVKYATFPRVLLAGVDVNMGVDGEMLANIRLTQQKRLGSLNVADKNKH